MTDLTLREAIADYLVTMQCENYSPKTVRVYGKGLRQLATFAEAQGCALLADLTPAILRGAMGAAMRPAPSNSCNWQGGHGSANNIGAAAKAMARRYRQDGFNIADMAIVRSIRQPERVQPRLTGPEFQALMREIGSRFLGRRTPRFLIARDTAILQVLVETGLRASEMCALNLGDVDFQEGTIFVRSGKGRGGGKDRVITIVDPDPAELDGGAALRSLADWLTYREQLNPSLLEQALWLTPQGNRLNPNALRRMLGGLSRKAGLSGNRPPHAFRRGWFTEQYQADPNSLPVLSARMGWTSGTMAKVYTRGAKVDLARTTARPSLSKTWRQAAEAREQPPRPKPAPVKRQEDLQALLGYLQSDQTLRRALLRALQEGAA